MFIVLIYKLCNGILFTRQELLLHFVIFVSFNKLFSNFDNLFFYLKTDTATVIKDRMYIYGGRGDMHAPYHSQEEIYCPRIVYLDLKSNHWTTPVVTGKIPIGRRSHSSGKSQKVVSIFNQS